VEGARSPLGGFGKPEGCCARSYVKSKAKKGEKAFASMKFGLIETIP
jgi:hypothetical protein